MIGAAGFVGLALLDELAARGVSAVAIVRGAPEILQGRTLHQVVRMQELGSGPRFDTVINLAYPTSGHESTHARAAAEIVNQALQLVPPGGRVVQVSTCAVFGPAVERPVVVGPVRKARDTAYVESKIDAEHRFAAACAARGIGLDVARLGNVVGPASPGWAVGLAQRLLSGRPVLVADAPGWSNATDVRNAASYLAFLATETDSPVGVRYHHVAEFYAAPWARWLTPLAEELKVPMESVDTSGLGAPIGLRAELAAGLRPIRPRGLYRALSQERVSASILRSALAKLPPPLFERLKGPDRMEVRLGSAPDREEQIFLSIMAGVRQFPPALQDGWKPRVSLEASVEDTVLWLRRN